MARARGRHDPGMTKYEELARRVDVLEDRYEQLREDYAATRTMAAMASQDVEDGRPAARGHTNVLNSIRETQIEHGKVIKEISELSASLVVGQDELRTSLAFTNLRFDKLTSGQAELRAKTEVLTSGQAKLREQIEGLTGSVGGLTDQVAGLTGQAAGLTDKVDALSTDVEGVKVRLGEMREEFAAGQQAILARLMELAPPSAN